MNNPVFDLHADGSYQRRDLLESEEGYSPLWRSLGVAAVGGVALSAHKFALESNLGYADKLYQWAEAFEHYTPNHMGATFRFSERASSYVADGLHFTRADLLGPTGLTAQGAHFQRVFGDAIDLESHLSSDLGSGGLKFSRKTPGSAFLELDGFENIKVRFTKANGHYAGASRRFNRPTFDGHVGWKFSGNPLKDIHHNWEAWRRSQHISGAGRGVKGSNGIRYAPWYAQTGVEEGASLADRAINGFSNLRRSVEPQAFELLERPQKLFAEFGFGLKAGSYNKLAHVPFIGHGGLLNNVLTKRVLPAAIGLTALRWLDYKLGHAPSNAVLDAGLKANVLRGDLTDITPGARSITDWYAENVPGPQYGPLALPAAGAFMGGLIHMGRVAFTDRYTRGTRSGRLLRDAEGSVFPKLSRLKRAASIEGLAGKAKAAWKSLGTPGKGAAVGLLAMLPFVPGMLGSRKTGAELRRIYSGEEDVPVRQGRWWEVGSNAFGGGRITAWRPHAAVLYKSRAWMKSLYGSEEKYWEHNPILHPLKYLKDPYWLEKEHYEDRPYPVTSPAFSNVPLVGPLLAATIGKIVKPVVRMHEGEWQDDDYTLYSSRLEPKGPNSLAPAKAKEEFGFWNTVNTEARMAAEYIGLIGFTAKSLLKQVFPDQDKGKDVYLQGSRQMDSLARQYYDRNLGAGMMISPETENGLVGYTEPLRRLVQHEGFSPQVNEIENTMPSWLPGDDHLVNFHKGDPYTKVEDGYARLPGAGYAALHPEVEGLDPEAYSDITKLSILGDVAPYSRQYNKLRAVVEKQSRGDDELRARYEQIVEQVRQTKESTLQVDTRRFDAPVDHVEGTIKSASFGRVELNELPGRSFHFSSVGSSMADLTADLLGQSNAITRGEAAQQAHNLLQERDKYLSDVLAEGSKVRLTIQRGAAESSQDIRAVIEAGGTNVNKELIGRGFGRYRRDLGGAEEQAMHGAVGRALGSYAEAVAFEGDNSRWNPLRYLPGQAQTKLWQERTAYSQYLQQEAVGTRMRRWERPIHDFLMPYVRGAVERITDLAIIPEDVQRRRDFDELTDNLQYLRALRGIADGGPGSGRYTSQAKRTAVGSNLFGSAGYVASTLPNREARYFKKFLQETDPEVRQRILDIVPESSARALSAQWAKVEENIREASGETPRLDRIQGREVTEEALAAYKDADTELGYGDWLRSMEIAQLFSRTGFSIPDAPDSALFNDAIDYEDVKLKLVQQEGYDEHDFNLFDDRASLLWRKPYLDGAVQELTAGDNRDVNQLRQAVEQMMLAAGDLNPDVRVSSVASPATLATARFDTEIQNEAETLREMRRNPDDYRE